MCRAGRFCYWHLPNLYYTHYSQPPKGCWIVHLAGTIILEKMSIHLHPNNMGKSWKRLLLPLFFPSREKRWLLPRCVGVKRASSFCLLPQATQQRTEEWWWLHSGGVCVLVTSCWRTAQLNWCAVARPCSATGGTNGSLLITGLCAQMAADQFVEKLCSIQLSLQLLDARRIQNAFATVYSLFHCAKLAVEKLKRQGSSQLWSLIWQWLDFYKIHYKTSVK